MNAVFVDTGGWMACADRADPAYASCRAARDSALEAGQTLITTDFVVDETLTLIRFRLRLSAAKERALLALLLIERGRAVPLERLIDNIWSERPPDSAGRTVRISFGS